MHKIVRNSNASSYAGLSFANIALKSLTYPSIAVSKTLCSKFASIVDSSEALVDELNEIKALAAWIMDSTPELCPLKAVFLSSRLKYIQYSSELLYL